MQYTFNSNDVKNSMFMNGFPFKKYLNHGVYYANKEMYVVAYDTKQRESNRIERRDTGFLMNTTLTIFHARFRDGDDYACYNPWYVR